MSDDTRRIMDQVRTISLILLLTAAVQAEDAFGTWKVNQGRSITEEHPDGQHFRQDLALEKQSGAGARGRWFGSEWKK